jgi:hypothetical protein
MVKQLLTATEIIEIMWDMELTHYKTIDTFLFNKFGWDYEKLPFYQEIKTRLGELMERIEINHQVNWVMKDI